MMMSKRRCAGSRATYVAGCLIFFVAMNPASGGIISDRSAFVGDFTVLDFETLGDGTPIDLEQGGFILMDPDEYASLGVRITTSRNIFGTDQPWIANDSSPQVDAAQAVAGSPDNFLASGAISRATLRFDFLSPVNSVAFALQARTDGLPAILSVFDDQGALIERVEFSGNLVDGTIIGADFGTAFDIQYGFVGLFSPDSNLSYAVLDSEKTVVDDLHFGAIPEPTTIFLLAAGLVGIWFVKRNRRRRQICVLAIAAILVLGTAGVGFAQQEITGNVTAWVVDGPEPICGDFGPVGCDQVPLPSFRCVFGSARFCLEPQACGEMK